MKIKLEKFEEEYLNEIKQIQSLRFKSAEVPEFKIPGYTFSNSFFPTFVYRRALSIAFAIPAVALVFGFFFYNSQQTPYNKDLAQIQESNTRILDQINTLDNENNI